MTAPTYTILIPVYNEAAVLPSLFPRLDDLVARLGSTRRPKCCSSTMVRAMAVPS